MTAHRRAALAVFCAFAGLYLVLLPGQIRTPDGAVMFRVSQALVLEHQLHIAELPETAAFGGRRVVDPASGEARFYAKYGLGQSLAALPAVAVAAALAPLVDEGQQAVLDTPATAEGRARWQSPDLTSRDDPRSHRRLWYGTTPADHPDAWLAYGATWTTPLVSAATLALLVLMAGQLGLTVRAGVAVAAVAGLASPVLPYATTFFSEPLAGLAWTGGLSLLLRARHRPWPALPLAGLAFGLMVLTRVAQASLALPLLLFWALEHRASPGTGLRRGAAVALGALPSVLLLLAYNALRFGDPLQTGYGEEAGAFSEPLWRGVAGLLLSPGRGLAWYGPAVLVGLACLSRLRDRNLAVLLATSLLTLLLLYGGWHQWEGGWCWGPRFLVPVLPALLLPVGTLVDRPPRRLLVVVAAVALLAGLVVALQALLVSYHDYYQWLKAWFLSHPEAHPGLDHYYPLLRWSWRYSPLVAWWTFPVRETVLLPFALQRPGIVLLVPAAGAALAVGGLLSLVRVLRAASRAAAR